MRRGVARCAVDPRLQARHEFEVLWREAKMGANGSDTPGSIPLVKLAGAIDAEELVFTQLGKTMGEDAQTFANLCTAAAAAADAMCAPAAGVEGGAVDDRGDRAPGALQWLRALSSIVREALRLDIHSQGSDAGESWQTLTLHSLLERGVGTSAAVALLLVAVADDVASRRPEWESLRLSAAPLADGSLSYWLVWCADAPAFVLDAYEGEVLMLGDLEAFMAPFAGEWGEEEVWFTNANGGVRLGEAQLEEHYRGGDSGDEVEGEVGPSSDADASEDADAEAGMGADDDRPLAVEQRWLLAAVLIALRDRYFGLATQVKQKSDHARPMLPLIGPAPEGAALTTEYQQEALNRAISASERLRMVAYDDAVRARWRDQRVCKAVKERGVTLTALPPAIALLVHRRCHARCARGAGGSPRQWPAALARQPRLGSHLGARGMEAARRICQ